MGPDGTAEDFGGMRFNNSETLVFIESSDTELIELEEAPSCEVVKRISAWSGGDWSEVTRVTGGGRQAQSIQELNKFSAESV